MNRPPPFVASATFTTLCLLATIVLGAAFGSAQSLPPGSLPPGPPPKPGQLGPPPKPLTSSPAKPNTSLGTDSTADVAPNSGDTIRVHVRNVLVPTTVLDPDGHGYVNGLQPSDFELFDNDKPQKITTEF